jgi:hypothetical protein
MTGFFVAPYKATGKGGNYETGNDSLIDPVYYGTDKQKNN